MTRRVSRASSTARLSAGSILIVQLRSLTGLNPMIDKLALASDDIDIEAFKKTFGETLTSRSDNKHYHLCQVVSSRAGEHLFTACSGPKNPNPKPYRLEFNPSKLCLNYQQILKRLDVATDIDDVTIQRIDHAADFEIPISRAFETVRVKRKQKFDGYDRGKGKRSGKGRDLTGFYIGSKNEQIVIYNKAYELRGKEFKKVSPPLPYSPLTRFEIRQLPKKMPFRLLRELPFLINYDPFEMLEVLELSYDGDAYEAFHRTNKLFGMQHSYSNLNKHNNFKRDSPKHFTLSDLPLKLTAIYRGNLGQFFNESEE